MNQKGGAASNHWLKVTRKNPNDVIVEILNNDAKTAICTPSSSASGGGANNPTFYTSFDEFVFDESNDFSKPLLLQLTDDTSNFANQFELLTLKTITAENINWNDPSVC